MQRRCDECEAGTSLTIALGKHCNGCMPSLSSTPRWGQNYIRSSVKSLLSGTSWSCSHLRLFFFSPLFHSSCRGGRQGELTSPLLLSPHAWASLNPTYSRQQRFLLICSLAWLPLTNTSPATSPPEQPGGISMLTSHPLGRGRKRAIQTVLPSRSHI